MLLAKDQITRIMKTLWGIGSWSLVGIGVYYLLRWVLDGQVSDSAIQGFVWGGMMMFVGLTAYGVSLQNKREQERVAGLDQFIKDQKADNEQEARIDKEMVKQLQNEHVLSGTQQDKRLKALEAALKHLRKN
mgnify:CR=1 FL=1